LPTADQNFVINGPGRHQLPPHDPGDAAADHPRDDREDQIERADVLVIGGHEPASEEARLVVGLVMPRSVRLMRPEVERVGSRAHDLLVRSTIDSCGLRRSCFAAPAPDSSGWTCLEWREPE